MKKNNEGFSMIEALVAIFILVWAIVAVSGLLQGGFKSFAETRDQITMDFLTQEGMEVIRSVRDSNISAKRDWDYGLDSCVDGGVCKVSMSDSLKIEECSGGGCELLRHNKETGQFGYNSDWEQSDFTRKIWIDNEDDNKANIHVLVEKSPTQKIEMKESLYDLALKDDPEEEDSGPVTITYFIPNPYKIYEGQESILYWSAKNATSCSGDSFETKGNTGGSVAVTPIATTKYTLTCEGPEGSGVTESVKVTVDHNPPLPEIIDFYVYPSTVMQGMDSTLYWNSKNATDCSLKDIDDVDVKGTFDVNPSETTAFTLICEGLGGEVSDIVTLTIQDEPFDVCGDVISHEGHVYETVEIGGQCWFAENLRYDNGCSENEWNSSSPFNACDNDGYHALLYQWGAAMDGSTQEGAQGLCPGGWHIPTKAELIEHSNYVDSNYDGGAGDQLKDPTKEWCYSTPCGGSGWDALPGGYRLTSGSLSNVGSGGYWWSSSVDGGLAWYRYLYSSNSGVNRSSNSQALGYSVRCLRD